MFPRRFLPTTVIMLVHASCVSQLTAAEAVRLRVLSYNIHHAQGVDKKLDLDRIAGVIRSAKPDVVALQEVDHKAKRTKGVDQAKKLGVLLKMHVAFGKNIDFQGGGYGNAVLSKSPIAKSENVLLPSFGGEQRGVLICELKHTAVEKPIRILATHLDHRADDRERIASAKRINELAAGHVAAPMILAGDINATPESDTLGVLKKVWRVANKKPLPTFPATKPTRQIDYVLFRPKTQWRVIEVRVIDEAVASDHRAILAELELIRRD